MCSYVGFGCDHFSSKIETPFSMLITTLSMITVCLHVHGTIGVQDMNIFAGDIQNMYVNQSSTYMNNTALYGPQNAIDRKDNYDIDNCGCCSVTNNRGQSSWWQVDLGQQYLIQGIQIYGRSAGFSYKKDDDKQLQDAVIYAGNKSLTQNQDDGVYIYKVPMMNATSRNFTKILDETIISQYFLVKLGYEILTLCEFKLLQVCDVDKFGVGCNHMCHCSDNKKCNTVTGECQTTGCYAGWHGTACDQVCSKGNYGVNCSKNCSGHCMVEMNNCDTVTGACTSGCLAGYISEKCDQDCSATLYGLNCSHNCSSLCKDTHCDKISGVCSNGCVDGYVGEYCNKACREGNYGHNCTKTCGSCQNHTACNFTNGSCENGCEPGYNGTKCSPCPVGYYGDGCDNRCHCKYGVDCLKNNGSCLDGCDFGWTGDSCIVCDVGRFGVDCNHRCHCFDNKTCNSVTGECQTTGCYAGWNGTACDQECVSPAFGNNCNNTCHCINGTLCDQVNGQCDVGALCDPGWHRDSCSIECVSPTYGNSCDNICHCINETHCDHVTGQCGEGECDTGWWGESCSQGCVSPAFGSNCRGICHCINGTNCDPVYGQCDEGECEPGWHRDSCSQVCLYPKFGKNCDSICHCSNGTHCDHVTGQCDIVGCDPGWRGESCSQGSSDSSPLGSTVNTSAVAGGVAAAILVIVVVVVIFVLYKREICFGKQTERVNNGFSDISQPTRGINPKKQQSSKGNINHSYEVETKFESKEGDYYSFGPAIGIKRHQLWSYIRDKMQNKCEEFYEEFTKVPYGLVHPCKDAKHPNNMGKNRYRDMYAYDHSRVKLVVTEPEEVDYINACYINGFDRVKKFVAAQGPWKNMVNDFWRLAWQINTDKIVMLTNLVELGTTKCLQYWPDEGELYYGKVCVKLVRTESYLDYDVRHLSVSRVGESTRKIKQFHFKSWPDKDVPDSTWCLVNYWRAVDTNEATGAGSILVHCSAGVGRTGTFIALDNLVNQCRSEGSMRPLQIVQSLRNQRVNMVQTKEQYVYLHEAVADALLISTHHIWTKQFEEVYQFLLHNEKGETESRLEFQFNLIERGIEETTPDNDNAEYSNVETLVTEGDAHRPRSQKTGAEIAPKLGAVYMPNYNGKNAFILTQSPASSTMDEFLTLIDEHKTKTVLMLTDTSSPCYKDSCQLHIPNFGSRLIEEKIGDSVIEQTFSYKRTHQADEKLSTIKQFRYTAWKENRQVPDDTATFIEFMEAVLRWQSHASQSQPVLIHCGDGRNRSGLTYAVLNELFRINMDGHVNIVDTVTKMKQRRRQMIAGYEKYQYCCKFLLAYIKHTQIYSNLYH